MTQSPALGDILSAEMDRVEQDLREATSYVDAAIAAPASHLAAAGGKRLRPLLTLMTSHLGTGVDSNVRAAAVAVELTHLATLYHDDVMDSAALRRGAPAAHFVYGNNVAILTGDLLFARASQIVAELGPEAVLMHAETFERLCIGQLHDTMGAPDGVDRVAFYIQVLSDKTGSLISTAARYGAMFAGADAEVVSIMEAFGEKIGVAFQLADDVIDLVSDSDVTGKTPGTDLREGVDTIPILLLRARAEDGTLDASGHEILAELAGDLDDDATLASAVAALRVHPVLDDARAMARTWGDDAIRELSRLPEGEVRASLEEFARSLVDRLA